MGKAHDLKTVEFGAARALGEEARQNQKSSKHRAFLNSVISAKVVCLLNGARKCSRHMPRTVCNGRSPDSGKRDHISCSMARRQRPPQTFISRGPSRPYDDSLNNNGDSLSQSQMRKVCFLVLAGHFWNKTWPAPIPHMVQRSISSILQRNERSMFYSLRKMSMLNMLNTSWEVQDGPSHG
eukprot:6463350-Amphidinium_carterae.2